jgi:hypothetical protein
MARYRFVPRVTGAALPCHRFYVQLTLVAAVVFLCGCSSSVTTAVSPVPTAPDDADYALLSARITGGPAVIPEGKSAEYVITYAFERRRSGGTVAPFILAMDEDSFLRFGDDELSREQSIQVGLNDAPGRYQVVARLQLKCENDEIKGVAAPAAGSGEGHENMWSVNPAEVYVRVQRAGRYATQFVESNRIDVACH